MGDLKLDAAALHAAARDKGGPIPEPFVALRLRHELAERELDLALSDRDQAIIAAREIGVPWVALARWTGLTPRRLDQIVNDRP